MLDPFDFCLISGEKAVRDALQAVISKLDPLALDFEEVSTVELVLAEALNNIVEHAYPIDYPDGPIRITCRHCKDGLHVTIRDEGKAMPCGQMPIGMAQDVDVSIDEMPEGGFGWFMIRDLARDVRYRRTGAENLLDLRLAVAIPRVL